MGSICATAADYCPKGFLVADGTILAINENQALFSLLNTTYGGDGRTTFALPNLVGRSAIGWGQAPGLSYIPLGKVVGKEAMALTKVQLPSHTHGAK
ncbi:hypothetical protein TALK_21795, partial [Thalassospira alkalitolerans]